jgi:monofunctional biosynthetic peptidoglycan transglycosylase
MGLMEQVRKMNGSESLRAYPADRIGGGHRIPVIRLPRRSRGIIRRWRAALFVATVLVFGSSWLMVLPLRWIDPPVTAFMLEDDSDRELQLHEWTPWADIGGVLPTAFVAAEDQRFADHWGFDVSSIRQSIDEYADGERLRGASTISQQLAKNLYLWPGRSFVRKGLEAYFTVLIEASLSKRRILELYLNVAELGPGIFGVGAASEVFFEKSPRELTDAEAALLAAVLPNPKTLHADAPSEYLRGRQGWIVDQMQRLRREGWLESLR